MNEYTTINSKIGWRIKREVLQQIDIFEETVKGQAIVSPYLMTKFLKDINRVKDEIGWMDSMYEPFWGQNIKKINAKISGHYDTVRLSASKIFVYLPLECLQGEIIAEQYRRRNGDTENLKASIKPIVRLTQELYQSSCKYSKEEPVKNPIDTTKKTFWDIAEQINIVAEDAIQLKAEVSLSSALKSYVDNFKQI